MLLPSRLARTYPHHAKQRRWSETRGCGAPMASTSFPTLISPLRESSRRAESLMGLAKPSRSLARSLTSRTSRPTGISASGASLSLSVTATPHFARVMQTSATADPSFRIPDGSRGPVPREVECFFEREGNGLGLHASLGPPLVVLPRGESVQVRTRGPHLDWCAPQQGGQHEGVHEAEGVQDSAVHSHLMSGPLLRDEVLGPADPTLRRHDTDQFSQSLVLP